MLRRCVRAGLEGVFIKGDWRGLEGGGSGYETLSGVIR